MDQIPPNITILAVTKYSTIQEVGDLLKENPQIKDIGENRYPELKEKFQHFKDLKKHFIGPIQSNKIKAIVQYSDVIQSVDNLKHLQKINLHAKEQKKTIDFMFQVNISNDANKSGIKAEELMKTIQEFQELKLDNVKLIGLMTIGKKASSQERLAYYKELKQLFDQTGLKELSMGMSDDYMQAIEAGATMIRLGRILFFKPLHIFLLITMNIIGYM